MKLEIFEITRSKRELYLSTDISPLSIIPQIDHTIQVNDNKYLVTSVNFIYNLNPTSNEFEKIEMEVEKVGGNKKLL